MWDNSDPYQPISETYYCGSFVYTKNFGMEFMGTPSVTMNVDNFYKYNGKELNETNGLRWYDYGFRRYDPQIGRMHVIDPKAESNQSMSPYVYWGEN